MTGINRNKEEKMRISTPFLPIPMGAVYDPNLNNTEKVLLADIFYFRNGPYFKSNKIISRILGLKTDRSVQIVISGLIKKGIIKKHVITKNGEFYRRYLKISESYYQYLYSFDAEKAVYDDLAITNQEDGGENELGTPTKSVSEGGEINFTTPRSKFRHRRIIEKNNLEEEYENIYISHPQTFDKVAETKESNIEEPTHSITKVEKRKSTVLPIPTLEEVEEWALNKGSTKETALSFFRYWEALDWKDRRGVKLKNWHRNFATWLVNEAKFDERQGTRRGTVNGIPHAPGLESFNKTDEEILRDLHNFGKYK